MSVWAIVPAGGSGTRFGARKQYVELAGRTLLDRCLESLSGVVDGVVVALPDGDDVPLPPGVLRVVGGSTRLESVRSALAAVPADADIVVVHGPSHPLADASLTRAVVAAVGAGADAAFPGLTVLDALKRLDGDGRVTDTISKDRVVLAQTPQAFRADVLRRVHASAPEVAEDTELIERAGGVVRSVPGDPVNLHIATPADLALAARILGRGDECPSPIDS